MIIWYTSCWLQPFFELYIKTNLIRYFTFLFLVFRVGLFKRFVNHSSSGKRDELIQSCYSKPRHSFGNSGDSLFVCCYGFSCLFDKETEWRSVFWGKQNQSNHSVYMTLSSFFSLKQKLDKFIAEINQLKSKQQSYCVEKAIKSRISRTLEQQIPSSNEAREELLLCRTCLESSKGKETPSDNKRLLRFASFSSIAFVYIQCCFLVFLTSQTQFKAGFVFLLACALYLNYIYLKVIEAFVFLMPAQWWMAVASQTTTTQTWKIMLKH